MRFPLAFVIAVTALAVLTAERTAAAPPLEELTPGAFSHSHLNPPELQFGCTGTSDKDEEAFAKMLQGNNAVEQIIAARALWKGHSRRYASKVMMYVAGSPPGREDFREFQREVDAALRPDSILKELKTGDYLWGTWLAFLRPSKDFVEILISGLKKKPELQWETTLALGNSGDPRALEPLMGLLKSKEYVHVGEAAQSLGYLGDERAEPALIELLGREESWVQMHTCGSLSRMGSSKALPALMKVANTKGYTGAINVRGCAMYAIVAIERRERKIDPNEEAESRKPTATLRGHADHVWELAYSPDGKSLASVSDDKTTRLWNIANGKGVAAYAGHARQMTKVAFVADGKQVATAGHGDDGSIKILESSSGKLTRSIPAGKGGIGSMVVSSDGKLLASYSSPEGKPEAIHIWDASSGTLVATVPKAYGVLAFSPDSKLLAIVGADSTDDVDIQLWSLKTQSVTATLKGHIAHVGYAAFSPDGKTIITGGDWTVRSWNVQTGKENFKVRGDGEIDGVSFNPDGKTIAFGEQGGSVHILDAVFGKKLKTLHGRGPISYSPDGKQLATGSEDRTAILLWNLSGEVDNE